MKKINFIKEFAYEQNLEIKNLEPFFDSPVTLAKKFGLDVGSGNDNWKEFKKCNFIGVDMKGDGIDVKINLEKPLPFKENVFDIVIAINSLNYIKNSRNLLNEIFRIMKKNGVIVCVVDNENSTSHPDVWSQQYLDQILKVTGFKLILKNDVKDFLLSKWYNKTSVYGFSVGQKNLSRKK